MRQTVRENVRTVSKSDPACGIRFDLLTVRRLYERSLPLDMMAALTNGLSGVEHAALAAVPLTDLGAPAVIFRDGHGGLVGQFQHRLGEQIVLLSFLASEPREGDCREWASFLRRLSLRPGARRAPGVCAEVAEITAFVAFRMGASRLFAPGPAAAWPGADHALEARWRAAAAQAGSLLDCPACTQHGAAPVQQADPLPDVATGWLRATADSAGLAIAQASWGS